ncbi:hypothetical protein B0I73DRAFT_150874 [Yarrowia lipolytica]|uniref:Uncharacterized protein n=1 Tax=Yarrowia lipolytica TaxID=4952 RepID=A0A371C4X8_YARLL|nr:hypothetical protein BKA90DRAFT_161379 [Yarrowia lipolytica]RDW25364.1 hypothetical protein B0I71DRAFT_175304 [Yarrowia lipolytica]RDW42249.1 hypothetical protein B0I73DRAFT_150874 [Yarrowia lipolytica]RMJ00247.1 hypothetical protein BD777DRAFT_166668 [Yarrowia lipolytica]
MAKAQENKLELAGILLFFILSAALFTRDIRSFQRDILPSYMETDMANMLGMDISVFLFIERAILFVTPLIIALRRKADDDQPQQEFDVPVELLIAFVHLIIKSPECPQLSMDHPRAVLTICAFFV